MKKLVAEDLGDILRPKSQEEVTGEIERRLKGKDLETIKKTKEFVIYHVKKGSDIQEIIKQFGGRDEDVFFNFYLILDNSVKGYRQLIGIKVSPDGTISATGADGKQVEAEYLNKFSL